MDATVISDTWNLARDRSDRLAVTFYNVLFWQHPETRLLFPLGLRDQRAKLVASLATVVARIKELERAVPILEELGRTHRRYGVVATEHRHGEAAEPDHYDWVGAALLHALEYHLEKDWTPEAAAAWAEAYDTVAQVMRMAALAQAARGVPPWWDIPVAGVRRARGGFLVDVNTEAPPLGYDLGHGCSIDLTPSARVGLWTTGQVLDPFTFAVPLNVGPRPDFAGLAVARLAPGSFIRIGPNEEITAP